MEDALPLPVRFDARWVGQNCTGSTIRLMNHKLPERLYNRPLPLTNRSEAPRGDKQGDPFAFRDPVSGSYYFYCTGEDLRTGHAVPVYRSEDLTSLTWAGYALWSTPWRNHWAPAVYHVPDLEYPYVMIYSHGSGWGPSRGHVGHALHRAHSKSALGPFLPSGHRLTGQAIDFAIDFDAFPLPDGTWRGTFAVDFVEADPIGTGVVMGTVNHDLTAFTSPFSALVRATREEHLYEADRRLPWKSIPGIDWSTGATVPRWHTVEGPSNLSEDYIACSGGSFLKGRRYFVDLIGRQGDRWMNVTDLTGQYFLEPKPERGLFNIGHNSWVVGPDGASYVVYHGRFGRPTAERRVAITPLLYRDLGEFRHAPYGLPLE